MPVVHHTLDAYIADLPAASRDVAVRLRETIHAAVPGATEAISYAIPTFRLDGVPFLYFGMWKKHVGLYPVYGAPPDLEAELAPYRHSKDTVRFLLKDPIDYELVGRIAALKAAIRMASARAGVSTD